MKIDSIASAASRATGLLVVAGLLSACDTAPSDLDVAADEPEAAVRPQPGVQSFAADASPVAQLPGFDVTIGLDADSYVTLDWEDTGATEYEVWYSRYPYFTPGVYPSTLADTVAGTSWVDPYERDYYDNLYYVVRPVGEPEQISTTVGRHRVTMHDGFSKISLSLETDFEFADDVFEAASPGAVEVFQFDSSRQAFESWDSASAYAPFVVDHGTTPVLTMSLEAPVDRILLGYVPAPGDFQTQLHPGDNLVHLPLHFPDTTASALLEAIPGATQVGRWDAEAQELSWISEANPAEDVEIPSGADLHVWMDVEAQADWPVERELVAGDCCESNGNAYCNDAEITECVCADDPYCCSNTWDSICANGVQNLGCGAC